MNKENTEKDDDDEFWINTCNSFVVQLAETQEKKKVKTTPVKKKALKEQVPQPPKRKYTKRIKTGAVAECESENKKISASKEDLLKTAEGDAKSEKPSIEEEAVCENESLKTEPLDMNKENNKTEPAVNVEKMITDEIKENENDEKGLDEMKPKRKQRLFKLKFQKPLITKMKKMKKEGKKELKMKKEEKKEVKKEEKKEAKKEEKKEVKKGEKKETTKKELLVQKLEKKELTAKEEKKGPKKEEKRDLKKDQQTADCKKDLSSSNKKEGGKKTEAIRKKVAAEKENVTKNNENVTRRSAAEAANKFNPRQSLRRKNSLKDYTFAFDELLDDAFAHFETDKIPVKKRRKCASPSPSPAPPALVTTTTAPAPTATAAAAVAKKLPKEKDNETIRMRLRSRNRPLLAKQEPQKTMKKKKKNKKNNMKNKIIPKRRRKKSLGEKSAHLTDTAVTTTDNWKDELYKFKRSLRLPSKLISVVSPPSAVDPDQVSLTSIMNIPPQKPVKEPKSQVAAIASVAGAVAGKNCKTKRLGHLFGRRDVFKGRRLMNREKIVSAEKLLQRNQRKRRQQQDEEKKEEEGGGETCAGEEATVATALLEDEDVLAGEGGGDEDEEDEDDDDDLLLLRRDDGDGEKPPTRVLFKRKFMRKKFRSGFDYIKKKKKKEAVSERKPPVVAVAAAAAASSSAVPQPKCAPPRYVSEIQADIKGWIVNKGHGETVLHRAARLGVEVSSFFYFILISCYLRKRQKSVYYT